MAKIQKTANTADKKPVYRVKEKPTLTGILATLFFTIISIIFVSPIIIVIINSLKAKTFISLETFELPNEHSYIGLDNYKTAITQYDFIKAVGWTVVITVLSVVAILLFCSMTAWYITRVKNIATKIIYLLCVFSMVIPFQMVMFTLAGTADALHLNTPWGIVIVYLGFGTGLAVLQRLHKQALYHQRHFLPPDGAEFPHHVPRGISLSSQLFGRPHRCHESWHTPTSPPTPNSKPPRPWGTSSPVRYRPFRYPLPLGSAFGSEKSNIRK